MRIEFTVPAVPVAQPRPRATAFAGRARIYQPTKHPVSDFKASVRMAAQHAFKGAPLTGPLRVDCVFVFPRTKGQVWRKRPMPRLPHVKKPDRDNIDKAVLDALTGILWADDCQVCAGSLEKWIAAGDEQPHVLVSVQALGG